jgi:hypothetical protein
MLGLHVMAPDLGFSKVFKMVPKCALDEVLAGFRRLYRKGKNNAEMTYKSSVKPAPA